MKKCCNWKKENGRKNKKVRKFSFRINGGTSRFSVVHDSVVINNKNAFIKVDDSSFTKTIQPNSFTIAGYSPATAQMLLIEYWKKHNKPSTINMLPYGIVQINK